MYYINFSEIDHDIKEKLQVSPFIHPTNSCYWFGGSIYNEDVYNKIFELKSRDTSKPFFITVPDESYIEDIWKYDIRVSQFMEKYPEKTFTFIIQRSQQLPEYINPGISSVWIQIAKWPLQQLLRYIDWPVFWTSANISWQKPIYSPERIKETFWDIDDLVFLDGWDLEMQSPSIIIDLTWEQYKILRWNLK